MSKRELPAFIEVPNAATGGTSIATRADRWSLVMLEQGKYEPLLGLCAHTNEISASILMMDLEAAENLKIMLGIYVERLTASLADHERKHGR